MARLRQRTDGRPTRLEVRAEHLKDYLCAREMALRLSWYRERQEVVSSASHITWSENPVREETGGDRWEGCVTEIHEGGAPFAAPAAVFRIGRENIDYGEDLPRIGPSDANTVWDVRSVTRASSRGVSEELLAAQAAGTPTSAQAPETLLAKGIELLNEAGIRRFGSRLFREHKDFNTILAHAHRFRAVDQAGLLSLAKDVARLTADSLDAGALQRIVAPPGGEKWGPLKSLEHVVARECDAPTAYSLLSPLHGVYNLRHADAHLPGGDIAEAYRLAQIDTSAPLVSQGYQLLHSCVTTLLRIARILEG